MLKLKSIALLVLVAGVLLGTGCGQWGKDDQQLVAAARDYLDNGKISAAVIELKNALQDNPDNAEARFLLGNINLDIGDFATAEKEFRKALSAGWQEEAAITGLARALLGQKKFSDLLEEIAVQDAYTVTGRANLFGLRAVAETGAGNTDQAWIMVAEGARLDPVSLEVLKATLQLQLAAGKETEARETLAKALDSYPDNSELMLLRAGLALQGGDTGTAEKYYMQVVDADPPGFASIYGWRAHQGLARLQLLGKQLDKAEVTISRLYAINSSDPYTNYLGALLSYMQGDYALAEQRLLEVLSVAPEHNPSQLLFGAVNYAQQDYEQAAYYLAKYLATVPANLEARKLLARTYILLDQHEDARDVLHTALSDDSEDAELLALAGLSELRRGEKAAGIAGLQKAVEMDPGSIALRQQLAAAYLETGDTSLAIKELKEILSTGGEQKQTETALVITHVRAGEYDQAINLVLDMLAGNREDPAILALAGNVFAASGDREEARIYFNRALRVQPEFPAATLALARVEELDGNMGEASELYKGLVRSTDKPVVPLLALARLAELQGNKQEVEKWLQQARESTPDDVRPRQFLAQHYLSENQPDKAKQLLREAISIAPEAPGLLLLEGRILMANGQLKEALVPLTRLVDDDPSSSTARILLGQCLLQLGQLPGARTELETALQQQPGNLSALALMTKLEMEQDRADQALDFSRRIQQLYPELYLGYEIEGDIWKAGQDYVRAVKSYLQAWERKQSSTLVKKLAASLIDSGGADEGVKRLQEWLIDNPEDAGVVQSLGLAYQKLGQYDMAMLEYERLLDKEADNLVALNNLAWIYMKANNPEALELAERAYQVDPENPGIMDTYGWIQVQQGRVDAGLRLLEQAMEQLSDNPEVRYHYGVALYKAGNKDQARQLLEELVAEGGSFDGMEEVQRILGQ